MKKNLFRSLLLLLCCTLFRSAQAQVGTGWVQYSPTKKIHLDDENGLGIYNWTSFKQVGSNTPCADYTYNSTNDTETFRIFDSRSNRSEIRLFNDYTNGTRQFEGYVTFYAPVENESLMQIWGSSTHAALTMTRGYASGGGHITCTDMNGITFGNQTIVTGCYGVEHKINIIHDQDHFVRWYVDGDLKCEQRDSDVGVSNYHKYGCYGSTMGNVPAVVVWRRARFYKDGVPPGADLTAQPNRVTVARGAGGATKINVTGFGTNMTLSVSNLPAGATAIFNPTIVTNGQGSSTLTITTTSAIVTGAYPLTITATGGGTNKTATVILGIVPSPWKNTDIGAPGQDGGASYSNGVFTANGSGSDIWGSADKFNFTHQTFSGDLTLVARVDSLQNTDPWAKAGLMVRESTNSGSKYIGIYLTPGNGVSIQYRSTNDAAAVDFTRNAGFTAPYWVKLTRAGNVFAGFRSADGANWTQVGSNLNITLAGDVLVGLPVTAHNDTLLNTATFSSVSMPSNFVVSASPASHTVIGGGNVTYQVALTNLNGFNNTVTFNVDGLPANVTAGFSPTSLTGDGTSTLTVSAATNTATGIYNLAVIGSGGGLLRTNFTSLIVSMPATNLLWNAAASSAWDTTTTNWFSEAFNAGDIFRQSNSVVFTDRANVVTNITIAAGLTLIPSTIIADADTNNYTIGGAGKLSGTGGITKSGDGIFTVTITNDFTGKTVVSGGILNINTETSLGGNPPSLVTNQLTLDGGTLQTITSFTIDDANRGIMLGTSGGTFDVVSNTLTISRTISGGILTKTGSGTLALNVTNTHSGGSVVTNGAFRANAVGAYGYGPVTVSGSGVAYLNVAGTHTNDFNIEGIGPDEASGNFGAIRFAANSATATTLTGTITLTANARMAARGISYANPGAIISGPITGNGGLELGNSGDSTNPGRITLSNPHNDWGGDTTIDHGMVRLGASEVIPNGDGSGNVILYNSNPTNDSLLDLNGFNETINGFSSGGSLLTRCIVTNSSVTTATLTVGDNDANGLFGGIIKNGAGVVALTKTGAGTETLTGVSLYTGNTTISNGILVVNGSLANSTVIVKDTATLSGSGTLNGSVTVSTGGTLSPTGVLTINNSLMLQGTTFMELNHSLATNDVIRGVTALTYGGTLALTNLSGTLATNDSFKLFAANTYSGAFALITPAAPGPNLAWDTNSLAVNGTLKIVAIASPIPHITNIEFNGTTLSISGTNGSFGGQYVVLSTTNIALPLNLWTAVLTNNFDGTGNFNCTNTVTPNTPQQFYRLQSP